MFLRLISHRSLIAHEMWITRNQLTWHWTCPILHSTCWWFFLMFYFVTQCTSCMAESWSQFRVDWGSWDAGPQKSFLKGEMFMWFEGKLVWSVITAAMCAIGASRCVNGGAAWAAAFFLPPEWACYLYSPWHQHSVLAKLILFVFFLGGCAYEYFCDQKKIEPLFLRWDSRNGEYIFCRLKGAGFSFWFCCVADCLLNHLLSYSPAHPLEEWSKLYQVQTWTNSSVNAKHHSALVV